MPVFKITGVKLGGKPWEYKYHNFKVNDEVYFKITTKGSKYSLVTFKPVNFEGAPVLLVNPYNKDADPKGADIYLPMIVDDWKVKVYRSSDPIYQPDGKYLKNSVVVPLKLAFEKYIAKKMVIDLVLDSSPHFRCDHKECGSLIYYILSLD